ncbi:MAG: LPS export ABC transporter periplasmic protein LptC [Desulfopila sp.]
MSSIRNRLTSMLFFLAVLALAVYLGRLSLTNPAPELQPLDQGIDLNLDNIQYTKASDGTTQWVLKARTADQGTDGIILARQADITIFDQEKGNIAITGDRGSFDPEKGTVTLIANVRVVTGDGWTLQSDSLEFDETNRTLRTDQPVTLSNAYSRTTGTGATIDLKTRTLEMAGAVHATIFDTAAMQSAGGSVTP